MKNTTSDNRATPNKRLTFVLSSENGSVLAGVIVIAVVLTVSSLGYLQLSASTAKSELSRGYESKAFLAAESGLLLGAEWLLIPDNCSTVEQLFPGYGVNDVLPDFSLNGIDVTIDIVKTADGATVRSTADSDSKTGYDKQISQNLRIIPEASFDTSAFNHAIVCNGTFDFGGCGSIGTPAGVNARLHANGAIDISGNAGTNINVTSSISISIGNNKTINGSIAAPSLSYNPSKVTITGTAATQAVAQITIPDIDLSPWQELAQANGQVLSSMPAGNPYTPPGGVLWLTGDQTITSTINGTLIVEGTVNMNGNVYPPDSGFAIASVNGDIRIGTGTVRGLIYAKNGNYEQEANGLAQGQIIVNGTIKKKGNSNISVYKKYIPAPPGEDNAGRIEFIAGSWLETNIVSHQ
jgi:hypothetical protein